MRIIGMIGWGGSGKTTLIAKVIPRIVARGEAVSTIKHAHLSFQIDQPGKDTAALKDSTNSPMPPANKHVILV